MSFVNPKPVAKTANSRSARVALDAGVGAIGLILLSPLLVLAAIAVVLEDGLPVFFGQERVGRAGAPFRLLKFRSMRSRMPGRGITASDDPRITRVGKVLRKYKIDELPQLWNVVKGEMSMVGPRPEVPNFVNAGDRLWCSVLQVRPGITDLASLVYRNEEELLARVDDPERYYKDVILPAKLSLNLEYLADRSFSQDLKLILLTLRYSFFPSRFDPSRILQAFSKKTPGRSGLAGIDMRGPAVQSAEGTAASAAVGFQRQKH